MCKYKKERAVAIKAMRQAAILCEAVAAEITPGVLEKKDKSPVTVADYGSQALICRILQQEFPDDPIIGEEDSAGLQKKENEHLLKRLASHVQSIVPHAQDADICQWIDRGSANKYSHRFWTLDPIDGTKGFLRKQQYAISLALIVNGEIVLGVLGCPNLETALPLLNKKGAAFVAVKGQGAYEIALESSADSQTKEQRLYVSGQNDNTKIRFCESVEKAHSSHGDAAKIAKKLGITAQPVRLDSQTKYAVVARGDAEAYLRLPGDNQYREKIWDHAGGVIIVEEAGGQVTDISGLPLDFKHGTTLKQNMGVIVSNGSCHKGICDTIKNLNIGKFS